MAKIPRYTGSGVTANEIQREMAGQISAQEAARTAFSTGDALARGAGAFAQAFDQIAMVRQQEELNSAAAQLQARLGGLDKRLEQRDPQLDANGKLTYTPGEIQTTEAEERKKIQSEIRESLSSAGAKRQFDRQVGDIAVAREEAYAAIEVTKQKEYLNARLSTDLNEAVERGDYDAAMMRLEGSVGTLISNVEYQTKKNQILTQRDQEAVLEVALDPDATDEDFDKVLTALEDGKYADGTELEIDEAERYKLRGMMIRERDSRADGQQEMVQAVQRSTFSEMYIKGQTGELSMAEVLQASAQNRLSTGDRDKLLAVAEDERLGIYVDSPMEMAAIEDVYNSIMMDQQYADQEAAMDEFVRVVSSMGVTPDTKREWFDKVRSDLNTIYSHPEVQDLRKAAYATVMGFSEGTSLDISKMMADQKGKFDKQLEVALKIQRDIRQKALSLGDQGIRNGELQTWYEGKIDGYKLEMQKATLAEIGVTTNFGPDGFTAEQQLVARDQIINWWSKQPDPVFAATIMKAKLDELEGMTGVDLTMPSYIEGAARQ